MEDAEEGSAPLNNFQARPLNKLTRLAVSVTAKRLSKFICNAGLANVQAARSRCGHAPVKRSFRPYDKRAPSPQAP
jgi:hypothetical protein